MQLHLSHNAATRTTGLKYNVFITLSIAALAISGCKGRNGDRDPAPGWTPQAGETVMSVPVSDVTSAIEARLTSMPNVSADRRKHVRGLYTAFGNVPLWLESDGFHQHRSKALLRALMDANTDALRIDDYPLDEVTSAVNAVASTKKPTAEQLAQADLMLTYAYVTLAEDLLEGQVDPKSLAQDWHIAANHEPIDSALVRSLRDVQLDAAIARMRPQNTDYDALRKELIRFRKIAANGGWPSVPAGKALKPGQSDSHARLSALRDRLRIEGFGAAGDTAASVATQDTPKRGRVDAGVTAARNAVYDAQLAGQLASFQARHGIVVDSILGAETVNSLNVTAQYRLGQIAANLERYRWMPHSLGGRYIMVNVPAFRLEAHDSNGTLEMKVIVGEEFEGKKTPVFADSMQTVVFRPYWFITPDIQASETEPKIAENPDYMTANDLEYYKDGNDTRIRQKPGPKNSLGLVKFLFPNSFNIYLHDTPQSELFNKDVRAFSHGCIRVEKPAELAQWVLGWDAERVRAAMQDGKDDQSVKLPQKLPVYIMYATAYARDGQLYFGNDLYSRDDSLVQAVSQSLAPSAEVVRRIDALRKLVEG